MSTWRRLAIVAANLEVVVDVLAILALLLIPDAGTQQTVVVGALVLTALGDAGVLYALMTAPIAINLGDPGWTRPNMKNALNAATVALVLTLLGFVLVLLNLGLGALVVRVALVVLFSFLLILDGTAARLVHRHA